MRDDIKSPRVNTKSFMKLLFVLAMLLVTTLGLNPLSVVSEAQHAESIAVDEGYKAAKALGKIAGQAKREAVETCRS
ncbi:hypothetical protein INT44_008029 [Umbelopsis vinacea]|uniref:Uncharacterized protein n=1 Tax=Umbelopsis vinacea TaxID=44442 RepID=A0A8H7UF18_9FUNG|nr:hypothetical protein INT44_008029 [Umbelopsis vinacea]